MTPFWRRRAHIVMPSAEGAMGYPTDLLHPPSDYERLRDQGAGHCQHCGAVVTPDMLKANPIQPARTAAEHTARLEALRETTDAFLKRPREDFPEPEGSGPVLWATDG